MPEAAVPLRELVDVSLLQCFAVKRINPWGVKQQSPKAGFRQQDATLQSCTRSVDMNPPKRPEVSIEKKRPVSPVRTRSLISANGIRAHALLGLSLAWVALPPLAWKPVPKPEAVQAKQSAD